MPTLSLIIRCHEQPERVARLVRLFLPHVDDVLVAAQHTMDEDQLAVIAGVGDIRLLRLPEAQPLERAAGYLHTQCPSDWVLRMDADEVPSAAMLASLRRLVDDPDHMGFAFPCRWLWPDRGRALARRPWWPDYHVRLVRNDVRLLDFPGTSHAPVRTAGPRRLVETPFLHAALILASTGERRVKAERYEAQRPGWTIEGRPFNEAYYLPESFEEELPLRPVDAADVALLDEVLSGEGAPLPPPRPQHAPMASHAEIDRHWARWPWPDEAYPARLEVADPDLRFTEGEGRVLHVAVENHGTQTYAWGFRSAPEIRLSYRWLSPDGDVVVVPEGLRTPMPGPVRPGERAIVEMGVSAPAAGSYLLEIDLLHEHLTWFGAAIRVPVEVTAGCSRAFASAPARAW